MKRKAKIIIILSLIVAFFALSVWYINKFILPLKFKGLIVNILKEKTGHDISIGKINYLPLTRFYLKDVILYDKKVPKNKLIQIEGLSFTFKLWPLLKKGDLIARLGLKDLTYNSIRLDGLSSFSLKRLPSPAHRPYINNLDGTIELINFSFATDKPQLSFESINGAITLQDNLIRLDKASFNYKNRIYGMEGALTDLHKDEPQGSLSLNSDILKVAGGFIIKDDYIQVKNMDGRLFDSSFNIMGDVKELPTPSFHLYGEGKIDLSDIKKLFSKSKYIQDSLKPAGLCNAVFFFNGRPGNLKASETNIKLKSNKIFLHGLALDDLYLDLRMNEGLINTQRFDVRPYLGLFNGSFNIDLNKETLPYSISFALKDSNLAKFSSDMNFGKEELSGLISSKCYLRGELASIDTIHGSGWITITDGRLWEIPLLSGVSDLLGMPHLRSVVFKEAVGNFVVGQRRISTEDLTFYSDKVNMTASGFADFDGNLDFLLNTNITQDLIEGSSDTAKIANLLISQAGNYMGKIKIAGTWKRPEYKLAAKPVEEIFKKEIKGLLEDMLR